MAHVLESYPPKWSSAEVRELLRVLSRSIYRLPEIEMIVLEAGIEPADVDWQSSPALIWRSVVNVASSQLRMPPLLDRVAEAKPALKERLDELRAARPVTSAEIPPGTFGHLPPTADQWTGFSGDGNRERKIVEGQPTFLDISFLQIGLDRARSVCRLTTTFRSGRVAGTAFKIGGDLLLTNHHVLYDWDDGEAGADAVEAWFDHELDTEGKPKERYELASDPGLIVGERAHDWAVIRTTEPIRAAYPSLSIATTNPPVVNDRVYIIQHPDGLEKKIAMAHNLVRHVDPDVVQYWTDTDEGSSGAPVFNERWEVVALHHYWVAAPAGDSINYRNQGRRIDRVAERMQLHGVTVAG
jgi:V8-like Glu-specific endopeptidase